MIAFDTETTGLLKPEACNINLQPFMIEIYACKFGLDGHITEEFEYLIRPPMPVPEFITKITGITDQDLENAPTFIEIYDELCSFFLGESVVFAHNCSFDISIVKNELTRHGLEFNFPWPKNHMCTVEISKPIRNKRLKLSDLYEIATGKTFIKDAHRAKSDVKALVDCVIWLMKEGFINEDS